MEFLRLNGLDNQVIYATAKNGFHVLLMDSFKDEKNRNLLITFISLQLLGEIYSVDSRQDELH